MDQTHLRRVRPLPHGVEGRVEGLVAEVGARRVRDVRGDPLGGERAEDRGERERGEIRRGPVRGDRLTRRLEARAVGLAVVHHVHGDTLERHPCAAGREPEVHDGDRLGFVEERVEASSGVGVMHGQDRAARRAGAETASVHRLCEPFRRVDGVRAEGLEAGDEDHTVARHRHGRLTPAARASPRPP